jgi:hypothetical protein
MGERWDCGARLGAVVVARISHFACVGMCQS